MAAQTREQSRYPRRPAAEGTGWAMRGRTRTRRTPRGAAVPTSAGWVSGGVHTHGRLVRELATRAGAAAVFTSDSLSPEARYPVAVEQACAVLEWIAGDGAARDLDPERIVIGRQMQNT